MKSRRKRITIWTLSLAIFCAVAGGYDHYSWVKGINGRMQSQDTIATIEMLLDFHSSYEDMTPADVVKQFKDDLEWRTEMRSIRERETGYLSTPVFADKEFLEDIGYDKERIAKHFLRREQIQEEIKKYLRPLMPQVFRGVFWGTIVGAALGLIISVAIPFLWYFLLARLAEVAAAVRGNTD